MCELTVDGFLKMGGLSLCGFLLQQGGFPLRLHLQCRDWVSNPALSVPEMFRAILVHAKASVPSHISSLVATL